MCVNRLNTYLFSNLVIVARGALLLTFSDTFFMIKCGSSEDYIRAPAHACIATAAALWTVNHHLLC